MSLARSAPPVNEYIQPLLGVSLYEREAADYMRGDARQRFIDFSLNVSPCGFPPASTEAIKDVLRDLNHYPDMYASTLRHQLASHHDVAPGMIFLGCGLDEVIKLIVWGWTSEGGSVITHVPTFPRYGLESTARGAVVHRLMSDPPWSVDMDAMARLIHEVQPEIVFLCTPNNPTGATILQDDIARLADEFPGTQFVVDEAMIYPLDAGAIPLASGFENIAVLRTFSKYYGLAGVRVGYAVAHPDRLAALEAIRPPFNVTAVGEAAAGAALEHPEFLRKTREYFVQARRRFANSVSAIPGLVVHGAASNMVFLELTQADSASVIRSLAQRGLIVADGKSFAGLESRNTLRISLQRNEDNVILATALYELLAGH